MRIIQLIDSLEAGGAERMAVSYANTLSNSIAFSGLIVTRNEGALKEQLSENVNYVFLGKKNNFDTKAFFKLRNFVKSNKVEIIHAHSSSFFWATLLKISYSKVKIIWHDHFGNRVNQTSKTLRILKLCSKMFYGIIAVNEELKNWAILNLYSNKVIYLPNFVNEAQTYIKQETNLNGVIGKRIVFLANLKNPKNHLKILEAFGQIHKKYPDWSLHLIGKDYHDKYSKDLFNFIATYNLQNTIFIYSTRNDISNILSQSTIGILGSTYEGFPVTLLEYGIASLVVMSTKVGYCSNIITHNENGLLFDPNNQNEIIASFDRLMNGIENKDENIVTFGYKLKESIGKKYSQKAVLEQYVNFLS